MSGKGKAKLKLSRKRLSTPAKNIGAKSVTITDMFKKQCDRNWKQSDSSSSFIDVDDDDVIFVESSAVSPYFNKMASSIVKKTVNKSLECASVSTVKPSLRKRKLSLAKADMILNCESINSKDTSDSNMLSDDKEENICDIFKRTASEMLTESKKKSSRNEGKSVPLETAATLRKQQNEDISSETNKVQSSTKNNKNVNSDTINHNTALSTPNTACINHNSSNEMDLDIKYSPVFCQPTDLTLTKSSVNKGLKYKPPIHSELSGCDIPSTEQICDKDGAKDKEILVRDDDNDGKKDEEIILVSSVAEEISIIETKFQVPYYLNSFETLLHAVMEDETNSKLFNEADIQTIATYQQLSDAAKKLYIRMFSRKLHWIPLNKLKYPEISEDLKPFLQELTATTFIDCDEHLTDLEEVLDALSASDIKTLAKSYHINSNISQKRQLVQELLKKSQQNNLTTMFGFSCKDVANGMLTRAKKYLNGIYKLRTEHRRVFVRVMMLFSLVNTLVDEDSGMSGQGQLFQMLMVNMGKLVYPTYTIEKVHCVFQDREDLIRFENALQLESDLLHCIDRGDWDQAYTVFTTIEKEWSLLEANQNIAEWNKNLPVFLRGFTATSVIHRLLSASVEILQRRKDYSGAVLLLQKLLRETSYNSSHRGYLWERLALNLDAHLKQPLESLEAVQNGLADCDVRVGHRLALYLRAESICQRPKLKLQHRLKEFHHEIVKETPKVYIDGRVLHQDVSANGTRFLTEASYIDGNSQDMTVVGVEEYVLDYYKGNGFPSGIHAEGSIVTTLFTLFFWDILFMPMPDAFHSPFQALPLDLYSNMFYDRRQTVIEERLTKLAGSSVQELQAQAEETWTNQQGVLCTGLNWDRMSLGCIKEILYCMGGEVLSGLIGRHARCPRHTRSGFPDLTLWNVETGALKICEVKGPGDRLSHKQILWIDFLLSLGVDAEVCHVKAVAAKRLKPSQVHTQAEQS